MCGIVGVVSWRAPVPPEPVHRALASLRHRGPDGEGQWCDPQLRCRLGHTRLALIDVAGGHQPIPSEDGQLAITANGEFYGFEPLQDALTARGHSLRTRSDSEVALHLYEEMGPDCLPLLRGEFAFAIWDVRTGTLFAARDRFGVKPLYWAEHDGRLVVASEIKALAAAGVPIAWDPDGAMQGLHCMLHPDGSLFRGVRQVPPGHYLLARDGRVQIVRYWAPDLPRAPDLGGESDAELIDRVGQGLEEAIELRLRADVPLGCYLSGGVDSSSVLGLAARRLGRPLTAFTIRFEHPDFDEHGVAGAQAAFAGCDYHPIRVTNRAFADVFADAVVAGEGLQINGHAPARFILSRAVQRAGIKAVLGGEGADELFLGYGFAEAALARATRTRPPRARRLLGGARGALAGLGRLVRPPRPAERIMARTSPLAALLVRGIGFPDALIDGLMAQYGTLQGLLHPDHMAAARDPVLAWLRRFDWRGQVFGREAPRQVIYLWLRSIFPGYVLAAERLDMAHAVEVRLPFLDHHLFALLARIPARRIAPEGANKWLLREAVRPHVTEAVRAGAKQPFFAPPSTLYAGNPMTEQIFDLLVGSAGEVPFLDGRAVAGFVDRVRALPTAQRGGLDPILYLLASAVVLQQRLVSR